MFRVVLPLPLLSLRSAPPLLLSRPDSFVVLLRSVLLVFLIIGSLLEGFVTAAVVAWIESVFGELVPVCCSTEDVPPWVQRVTIRRRAVALPIRAYRILNHPRYTHAAEKGVGRPAQELGTQVEQDLGCGDSSTAVVSPLTTPELAPIAARASSRASRSAPLSSVQIMSADVVAGASNHDLSAAEEGGASTTRRTSPDAGTRRTRRSLRVSLSGVRSLRLVVFLLLLSVYSLVRRKLVPLLGSLAAGEHGFRVRRVRIV